MADINQYAVILAPLEGKLGVVTNISGDSGSYTNDGVTLATYSEYCSLKGLPVPTVNDLKSLDYPTWLDILKVFFWDKIQGDKINNQSIANFLCDFEYNSGIWGIKTVQKILGLTEDCIVGNKTLSAINNANQQQLHDQLRMQRTLFVNNIAVKNPLEEKFENGWHNRINSFTFQP